MPGLLRIHSPNPPRSRTETGEDTATTTDRRAGGWAMFTVTIYPIWGIVMLALAVLTIYGLSAHGDEVG